MDTPTMIHLQFVRYGSHYLHDFKWTDPFGEKLAISFSKASGQLSEAFKRQYVCASNGSWPNELHKGLSY
jgi:hypothetical protein